MPDSLVLPARPLSTAPLRSVATAFLRRRPFIVAPMLASFLVTLALGDGPRLQVALVGAFGSLALGWFGWEAWRGRRQLASARQLAASMALTMIGIGFASMATGGVRSPMVFMIVAPTAVSFAAFGRGRASNGLLALALAVLLALALIPPGFPLPPLSAGQQRLLLVVCAADALVLLRVGVSALTDAHAAARAVAASAGEDVVAAAAARAAALEAMGAKVAHEVRNPLSAIRGLVEIYREKTSDPRDRQRLQVVIGEVDRINEILTGYLALARPLEQIQTRPHDLGQLVGEVAAVIEARAERAGVVLAVQAEPASAEVDPRRVKEALLNLALNAIEHTPPGGRVSLRAAAAGGHAEVSVEDSGPGMDAARLAVAGTPFATGRPQGTGLGLAIARQAIEQHGGSLVLDSVPGRGTVARVKLPRQAAAAAGSS